MPEQYELLTYIVSRNAKALIAELGETFSDYLEDASDLRFNSLLLDTPALQHRLAQEMENPEGSSLIERVETLYGRQVLETLYAATLGRDGRPVKMPKATRTKKPDMRRRVYWFGGFVMIVAIPVAATLLFRADPYTNADDVFRGSAILNYASSSRNVAVVASEPPPDNAARVLAEARTRKQDLFVSGGFGPVRGDATMLRSIPQGASSANALPADLAGFTRLSVQRFEALTDGETAAEDVSVTYGLARDPLTIFEVTLSDLHGLPEALDAAVSAICAGTADAEGPRSTSLSFVMGSSPFVATSITARDCAAGSYEIMPLFEMTPEPS